MGTDGVKGQLGLMLLSVLSEGPAHGYAVITALRDRSDGLLELTEGSVYPALHRLEDAGLLASRWEAVAGRRRRMYEITPEGLEALSSQHREWRALVDAVNNVLRRPKQIGVA